MEVREEGGAGMVVMSVGSVELRVGLKLLFASLLWSVS